MHERDFRADVAIDGDSVHTSRSITLVPPRSFDAGYRRSVAKVDAVDDDAGARGLDDGVTIHRDVIRETILRSQREIEFDGAIGARNCDRQRDRLFSYGGALRV